MDLTADMQSLLDKLDALELTEGERAAFGQLLGTDEGADVEGFGLEDAAGAQIQGFNLGVVLEKLVVRKRPAPSVVDHKSDD